MTHYAIGLENHAIVYRSIIKDTILASDQDKITNLFENGKYAEAHDLAKKKFEESSIIKDGRHGVQELLRETYYTTLIHFLTSKMEIEYQQGRKVEAEKTWDELNLIFNRSDLAQIYPQLYGIRYMQQLSQIFNKYNASAGRSLEKINQLILGI
ncbi:hypothetical protein [Pedobacter arcticus]|uniref:hypothetical protein n=1 Tax=Pedobacter arcticus TaxID=752140 RepID=UPI00037731B9|nr:hypothetical protein [Pedobacter arcticus]